MSFRWSAAGGKRLESFPLAGAEPVVKTRRPCGGEWAGVWVTGGADRKTLDRPLQPKEVSSIGTDEPFWCDDDVLTGWSWCFLGPLGPLVALARCCRKDAGSGHGIWRLGAPDRPATDLDSVLEDYSLYIYVRFYS